MGKHFSAHMSSDGHDCLFRGIRRLDQLAEAPELTLSKTPGPGQKTYAPRGSTALLDAIGRTVTELGTALAAMPEEERPCKVIVIIMTDGLENASNGMHIWE